MFRFTIRDVLWLTVTIGLCCAIFIGIRQQDVLIKEKLALTEKLNERNVDYERLLSVAMAKSTALEHALSKVGGRRVSGGWWSPDPSDPKKIIYEIDYDEPAAPATPSSTDNRP